MQRSPKLSFSSGLVAMALAAASATISFAADDAATAGKSGYELDVEGMIAVRFYATVQPVTYDLERLSERIDRNIRDLERYIPEAQKYRGGYSNWYPLRGQIDDFDAPRVPNFFPKDEAAALRAAHAEYTKNLRELVTLNDSLAAYLKDTASKDDDFKKYTGEKPRLLEVLEKARAAATELDTRARKLGDAGETRTLSKNPRGIFITNMREMIALIDQLPPLVDDPLFKERDRHEDARNKHAPETEEEKASRMKRAADTAAKLDDFAGQITALAAKHKAVPTDVIQYENKSATETSLRELSRFYDDDCGHILESLSRCSKRLREKGIITNYDNSVRSHARNLRTEHDEFAHMFNLWNDDGTQAIKLRKD